MAMFDLLKMGSQHSFKTEKTQKDEEYKPYF